MSMREFIRCLVSNLIVYDNDMVTDKIATLLLITTN